MNNEPLIQVKSVSKKYCRDLKRSLWYGAQDIATELAGFRRSSELRTDEFWAVRDINFELHRGECLGLIGHNGAGKSTLLKMLNGLIKPDRGHIIMKGRVGALIELGAGFNPILTGRENIYNNGAVLGFTKREINEKFDAIVEFAEIGNFLDTPVQNYSSGMRVRLGFSVAAQMDPDVLLIDEVLAVGDLNFKLKCFNLIDQYVANMAVVFVSHSMQLISRLCDRILMLEKGMEKYMGDDVSKGIDTYYQSLSGHADFIRSNSHVRVLKVLVNGSEEKLPLVKRLDDLNITLHLEMDSEFEGASSSSIVLFDHEQKSIGVCMNEEPIGSVGKILDRRNGKTHLALNVKIPHINLSKGIYYITFTMAEAPSSKPIVRLNNIKAFQVTSKRDVWPPLELDGIWYKDSDSNV